MTLGELRELERRARDAVTRPQRQPRELPAGYSIGVSHVCVRLYFHGTVLATFDTVEQAEDCALEDDQ